MSENLKLGIDREIERLLNRVNELKVVKAKAEAEPELYNPVIEWVERVFANEHDLVWDWLCKPLLRFGDLTPLAMVAAGRGAEVTQLLGAIEHGVYL